MTESPNNSIQTSSPTRPFTNIWKRRETWVQIYTSAFSVLGIVFILVSLQRLPTDKIDLLAYVALGFVTELLSVELFATMRGSRVSAASIISVASMLSLGPFAGVLVNSACGLASTLISVFSRKPGKPVRRASLLQRSLFNISMLALSTGMAGLTYLALGGTPNDPLRLTNLFPAFVAILVSEICNILILVGVILLQTGQPVAKIWEQNFRWSIPISVISGILGCEGLAIAYNKNEMIGVMLFFLPVLAVGYSFRLYINNMRVYVDRLEKTNQEKDEINASLLKTLGAVIDAYDVYTYGHSAQVAVYAAAILDKMGINGKEKTSIVNAALAHDIGKIGIMDSIMGKPTSLTDEERRIVERHPIISADILRQMKGLQDLVPLVRYHHERWDGQGYPAGLSREEIPFGARVITLADAVDAMCSSRPYRGAMKIDAVRAEVMCNSGTQFDPRVVEAFLKLADEKDQSYFKDSATTIDENIFAPDLLGGQRVHRYLKRGMFAEDDR